MMRSSNASDRLLQLLSAGFILLGPTVLGGVCRGWGLYGVFALLALTLGIRLMETKKIHISANIILCLAGLIYDAAALLWADCLYSHIRLMFTTLTILAAMLLAADYFCLEKEKRISERLEWLIIVSSEICAAWNIVYWAICEKFSFAQPFCAGIGSSDLLGVFMLSGLLCCIRRMEVKRSQKKELWLLCLPMIFAAVMSRSLATLFLGAAWLVICEKKHKIFSIPFRWAVAVSAVFLAICGALRSDRAFIDGLMCAVKYPAGLGGGGFLSRQGQLQSAFYQAKELGMGADIASSLGAVGLLILLAFSARLIYVTLKYRSYFDGFMSLLSIFSFFTVMSGSLSGLLILFCAGVYGEWRRNEIKEYKTGYSRYAACAVLVSLAVYGAVLGISEGFYSAACSKAAKQPKEAVSMFETSAQINPLNGESSYAAAKTLCESLFSEGSKNDAVLARYHIRRAIELEPYNGVYYSCYGNIEYASGNYSYAAEQYEKAAELAPKWDRLKVDYAKCLYALIGTMEKGSVEAQQRYSRILELGEAAKDMSSKKLINDFADEAQPYIRPDFEYEYGGEEE